jgi:hypothetical protein
MAPTVSNEKVEQKAERKERRRINSKMRRLLGQLFWKGKWELMRTNRHPIPLTWKNFRPDGDLAAVTPVVINGKQWWAQASLHTEGGEWIFLIGLLAPLLMETKVLITLWEIDPRELDKPAYEYPSHEAPRYVVATRENMKTLC